MEGSETVIKIENLSKLYRLGQVGTGTLAHDLNRWWANVRGKEDPYAKIGQVNDRTKQAESDYVWALKDINLEVKHGEVLGIIGRNGAGKSTLLKLISRITAPTTGEIKAKGRIASLLEVGTGMHNEMTARENIFLNGAILGMKRQEIARKFDDIVDFAGCVMYVDTPVKRYSSGMRVRLGFAVAAFLEPDILIVDEVLAVGDAEFQKKAIGKMKEVSTSEGRTVLFVSHNMGAVKALCTRGLMLENGKIDYDGNVEQVIDNYMLASTNHHEKKNLETLAKRYGNGKVLFADFWIEDCRGNKLTHVLTGEDVIFVFKLKIHENKQKNIDVGFSLHNIYGDTLSILYSSYQHIFFDVTGNQGDYKEIRCKIRSFPFSLPSMEIKGRIVVEKEEADWPQEPLGIITIEKGDFFETGHRGFEGNIPVLIKGEWL